MSGFPPLTPDLLLRAYAMGVFPMAESAVSNELRWYDPPIRALIPLDENFHIPRRLARTLRKRPYRVTLNTAFTDVMRLCAEPAPGRESTWINQTIRDSYSELHRRGHAHSIEVWQQDMLIGGLYGVSLGQAFFGESMFSRARDASKIALVHLVALLCACGYRLLDTQFQTDHLQQFGTYEITRTAYQYRLAQTLAKPASDFPQKPEWPYLITGLLSLHPVTQIS